MDHTRKRERLKFFLKNGSHITVDQLSTTLETSRRSVLRLIAELKENELDIKYSRSLGTYYLAK